MQVRNFSLVVVRQTTKPPNFPAKRYYYFKAKTLNVTDWTVWEQTNIIVQNRYYRSIVLIVLLHILCTSIIFPYLPPGLETLVFGLTLCVVWCLLVSWPTVPSLASPQNSWCNGSLLSLPGASLMETSSWHLAVEGMLSEFIYLYECVALSLGYSHVFAEMLVTNGLSSLSRRLLGKPLM